MTITANSIDTQGNITVENEVYNIHASKMIFTIEGIMFSPSDCVVEIGGCENCGGDTINLLCLKDDDGEKELITCKKCNKIKLKIRISEKNE